MKNQLKACAAILMVLASAVSASAQPVTTSEKQSILQQLANGNVPVDSSVTIDQVYRDFVARAAANQPGFTTLVQCTDPNQIRTDSQCELMIDSERDGTETTIHIDLDATFLVNGQVNVDMVTNYKHE
jgi:hypothetical protein